MKKVCGLDIHKDSIFCAIYDGKKQEEVKEFSTFTASIRELGIMLKKEGVREIAMESTGIYWVPVWNILEEYGFSQMLVNPYLIRQMPGRKSDVKDAQWIATLLFKDMLRGSFIPEPQIRELRSYSREYVRKQERITSILTKIERLLEMSNIRITSLVSNIHSESVLEVIRKIIRGEDSAEELMKSIHGRILNREGERVKRALEGHIEEHHRLLLRLAYEEYELLVKHSEILEEEMNRICDTYYKKEIELLKSIPGIKKQSAMQIIAEAGTDMRVFENSSKFTGWAGLRPRNDESAGKIKSTATTKGNKYLRRIIVQCGWAASRTKGSKFQEVFIRLCARKSRKKSLIAVGRKLLTVVWNVLRYKQPYNPNKQPVYNLDKLKKKLKYHRKQVERLELLTAMV